MALELVEGAQDGIDLARLTQFVNNERVELYMVDYWKEQAKGRWSIHWLIGQVDRVIRDQEERAKAKLYKGRRYTHISYQLINAEDRIRKENLMVIKVVGHFQVIKEAKEIIMMWVVSLVPTGIEMAINTIRIEMMDEMEDSDDE